MAMQAFLAAALLAATSLAVPAHQPNSTGDGCAQLSQYLQEHPKVRNPPASVAYACLQAVPVDTEGDIQLVSEISNILEWQSTLAYLKDPPEGYPNPPVDMLGGLEDIKRKIANDGYHSEYEVQNAISGLLGKAYDGHLVFNSDLASLFGFGMYQRSAELVSVSLDGKSLPKVYFKRDIDAVYHGNASFSPSAIRTINNQSAHDYLDAFASNDLTGQDPDARYQNLFYNPAAVSQTNQSTAFFTAASSLYSGDWTVFGHENGTSTRLEKLGFYAVDRDRLSGVTSGKAFFDEFLAKGTDPSDDEASTTPSKRAASAANSSEAARPTAFNYPYPVIKTADNTASGYFLNDTGFEDVAVLSSPSFEPTNATEFRTAVQDFLAAAVAARKQRLVIDLRHNGGGLLMLGFDLFKQLFPQLEPYGASRMRVTPAIDAIGQVVSQAADDAASKANETELFDTLIGPGPTDNVAEFWYRMRITADDGDFASWADLVGGPQSLHGDNFTQLMRNNWSMPLFSGAISGYGELADVAPQPFKPENIVLLLDGYCASTCAVFAELMRTQGAVKQLMLGGRPHNTGAVVGVGGTKGAETLNFEKVIDRADQAAWLARGGDEGGDDDDDDGTESEQTKLLAAAGVLDLADNTTQLFRRTTSAATGQMPAQINYRNNYRLGDASNTPLQFVRDYADCRLWYTPPMLYSPVPAWNAVAAAMWRTDGARCVPGSEGHGISANGSSSGH